MSTWDRDKLRRILGNAQTYSYYIVDAAEEVLAN
jgi:hypothetical protein